MGLSEASLEVLIGIIMVGISLIFGLTVGVQIQQYVTASSGNFSGISLFIVQNVVTMFMLAVMAIGVGFIYHAYKSYKS